MAAASRNHQVLKHTIRLFSSPRKVEGIAGGVGDELDESDVWGCQPESKPDNPRKSTVPRSSCTWKKSEAPSGSGSASGSVPVSIPDWYKASRSFYNGSGFEEVEEEEEEEEVIVPPHEVVRRRRAASLSVVEGAGRTLKGRDLSRVRNAVWAQTGFQD